MSMYRFLKSEQQTAQPVAAALERIEAKYSVRIPETYREFLLKYNDMPMRVCVFRVDGAEVEVSKIFPVILVWARSPRN